MSLPHFWNTVRRKRLRFEHMQTVFQTSRRLGSIFAWSGSELWTHIKYSRSKIKIKKPIFFSRPIQWYHSQIQSGRTVPFISGGPPKSAWRTNCENFDRFIHKLKMHAPANRIIIYGLIIYGIEGGFLYLALLTVSSFSKYKIKIQKSFETDSGGIPLSDRSNLAVRSL